jgi:hypothetical protein
MQYFIEISDEAKLTIKEVLDYYTEISTPAPARILSRGGFVLKYSFVDIKNGFF